MNKLACIIEDNDENDSIILSVSIILFLFMFDKDKLIEGIENSISPLSK